MVSLSGSRFGLRDARAPAAGDLVAHAGKAEFDVDRADIERAPIGRDLRRQAACRGDDPVARIAKRVHHADGLRVGIGPVPVGDVVGDIGVPFLALALARRSSRRAPCSPIAAPSASRPSFASPTTGSDRCFCRVMARRR
jgi:hypothetical protein